MLFIPFEIHFPYPGLEAWIQTISMGEGNTKGKLFLAFFTFGKARPAAQTLCPSFYNHPCLMLTGVLCSPCTGMEDGCGNCRLWVISSAFLLPAQALRVAFFFHGQMICLFVLEVTSVLCEFWILSNAKLQLGFEFHRLTTDTQWAFNKCFSLPFCHLNK